METQALEAIYGDDYKKLDEPPNAFEVTLVPEAGAGVDQSAYDPTSVRGFGSQSAVRLRTVVTGT